MATKFRDLVIFASELKSTREGMTKKEMLKRGIELGLFRRGGTIRTIDRWLAELKAVFNFKINSYVKFEDKNQRRYKVLDFPNEVINLSQEERTGLEILKESLTDENHKNAITKVLATQQPLSNQVLNDLSELIDNTSYASQIAPRSKVDNQYMQIVEEAIKGYTKIRFKYRSANAEKSTIQEVSPIGLIFSRFGYLVAFYRSKTPIVYRLDLLQKVEATDKPSDRDEEFNFQEWSEQSFGIFHGDKTFRAEIRFSKKVAHSVKNINFHSSQQMRVNKDKSITLIVICKGMRELIYELLNPLYFGEFKIIQPVELQRAYQDYLTSSLDAIEV